MSAITELLPKYREINAILTEILKEKTITYIQQRTVTDFYKTEKDVKSFENMILYIILQKDDAVKSLLLANLRSEIENNIRIYESGKDCLNSIDTVKLCKEIANDYDYSIKVQMEKTKEAREQFDEVKALLENLQHLTDLNIVVGQNDIGKSNFLKALNLFFNDETDLGKKFRFDEDFSRFAEARRKKAPEIVIKITFKIPYAYRDRIVTWTKSWRKEGLVVNKISNQHGNEVTARSGGYQWVKKIQYRYVPAIKGTEYFTYIMGELHDTLGNVSSKQFEEATNKFVKGLGTLMTDLTHDMDSLYEEECKNEVSLPSNIKELFSTLSFTLIKEGQKIPLDKRGDGIKARHIPIILHFIAKHLKSISGKGIIPIDTIWGFEEPENNMELTTAFKAAKQFYDYSTNLQIFLNTHSPAFYQLGKKTDRVSLLLAERENDSTETNLSAKDFSEVSTHLDEHMGLLPIISDHIEKEVEKSKELSSLVDTLRTQVENLTKPLIITEGKTDWKHLKKALQYFQEREEFLELDINFHEYNTDMGDGDLEKILTKLSKVTRNNKVIGIFDRDDTVGKKIAQSVPFKCFSNKVYAFAIENPPSRADHEGISIEHLYADDDLLKKDNDGHRIFLSSEFNELGRLRDDNSISVKNYDKACAKNLDTNKSKIVDCDVTNGEVNNIALSKSAFAEYIFENIAPFDTLSFEGFRSVFMTIKNIVATE